MNPIEIKKTFAEEIVTRFHGKEEGVLAREGFANQFKKGQIPDDIAEITLTVGAEGLAIANVLKDAGLTVSTSEAFRMIKQGAVKIDSQKIDDRNRVITQGNEHIIQVGKRKFAKVTTV
jgi:tyrosyl-tRNA synthetase